MKKEVIVLFLIGVLFISPLVLAQEEAQVYSNLDRIVDNVKFFFSAGDNKVGLALEIREKEVNSAIENLHNNEVNDANDNLENAMNKLLVVQERVSSNVAGEVEESVNNVMEKIEESDLTETFERYVLEEEKTGLVAKLVVEVEGKEGQTLTREVVQSDNENRRTVKVTVRNENGEIEEREVEGGLRNEVATHEVIQSIDTDEGEVWEIVEGINKVENQIVERVVKVEMAQMEEKANREVSDRIIKTEVKKDGGVDDDVASGPQGIVGYQGEDNGEKERSTEKQDIVEGEDEIKNEVVEGDGGEGDYAEGTTAEGENNIDSSSSSESSGDESSEIDSSITGEVIADSENKNFLGRIFNKIFGI